MCPILQTLAADQPCSRRAEGRSGGFGCRPIVREVPNFCEGRYGRVHRQAVIAKAGGRAARGFKWPTDRRKAAPLAGGSLSPKPDCYTTSTGCIPKARRRVCRVTVPISRASLRWLRPPVPCWSPAPRSHGAGRNLRARRGSRRVGFDWRIPHHCSQRLQ